MNGSDLEAASIMDPRIAQVISSMEHDLDGSVTITALADSVGLSPSRLAVLFKRETGVTPVRYLRALRMERARLLLERTFLSVREVMAFVGVNDPSHFTRDFSRHHGIAPSRLRPYNWAPEAWRSRTIPRMQQAANHHAASPHPRPAVADAAIVDTPEPDGEPAGRLRDRDGGDK